MSLNHLRIRALLAAYRNSMMKFAREVAVLQGKNGTEYEWIHGLRIE